VKKQDKIGLAVFLVAATIFGYATSEPKAPRPETIVADAQRQECIDLRNKAIGASGAHVDPRFNLRGMSEDYILDRQVDFQRCRMKLEAAGITDLFDYNYKGVKDR